MLTQGLPRANSHGSQCYSYNSFLLTLRKQLSAGNLEKCSKYAFCNTAEKQWRKLWSSISSTVTGWRRANLLKFNSSTALSTEISRFSLHLLENCPPGKWWNFCILCGASHSFTTLSKRPVENVQNICYEKYLFCRIQSVAAS